MCRRRLPTGDILEEALLRAEDALEAALAMYVVAKEPLPKPSAGQCGEVASLVSFGLIQQPN